MATCVVCARTITGRMFALECDACKGWCHLKCQKGVTVMRYREAVRKDQAIDFLCPPCESYVATAASVKRQSGWFDDVGLPVTESTRLSAVGEADDADPLVAMCDAEDDDTYRYVAVNYLPFYVW